MLHRKPLRLMFTDFPIIKQTLSLTTELTFLI